MSGLREIFQDPRNRVKGYLQLHLFSSITLSIFGTSSYGRPIRCILRICKCVSAAVLVSKIEACDSGHLLIAITKARHNNRLDSRKNVDILEDGYLDHDADRQLLYKTVLLFQNACFLLVAQDPILCSRPSMQKPNHILSYNHCHPDS